MRGLNQSMNYMIVLQCSTYQSLHILLIVHNKEHFYYFLLLLYVATIVREL